MKLARAVFLAAALVTLVVSPRAAGAVAPFEINAVLPVAGYGAFLGREEVETLTLLADVVNRSGGVRGRPIKFVIQDDQSNPQVGVCSAVIPLLKDGPVLKELLFPVPPALTPNQLPPGPLRRSIESFRSTLKSAGIKPTGSLAIEAYRRIGFDATPAQIRTFLAGIRNFVGVEGQFDFRAVPQRDLSISNVVIIRWDAAQDDFVGVSRLGGASL